MPLAVILASLLAAPFVALGAVRWRRVLVLALPWCAILNGLPLTLGGASIRLDAIVAALLVVPLVAGTLAGTRRVRTDPVVWWLAAILAMNVVSSVSHSPTLAYSLQQCGGLASVWVIDLVLLDALDTRAELDAFVRAVVWAALAGCAIGAMAFLLALAGFSIGGAEVSRGAAEHLTNAYGAYGTMVEPNILGSFAGAALVLAVGLVVAARRTREARWARRLIVAAAVALVCSFTRAAWLGAALGLATFVVAGMRALGLRVRITRVVIAAAAIGTVALVLALLPGGAGSLFRFKLANLVNLESQTAVLRLLTYGFALDQTSVHPIVGWGTFTFAPLVAQGSDFQQFENWKNLWIGNWLLLALHDTGVIGALLWLAMLWSTLTRGLRAARTLHDTDPALALRTLALTAAVASLVVPFLATTGFSLGWPWVLIGLLGAHVRLAEGLK